MNRAQHSLLPLLLVFPGLFGACAETGIRPEDTVEWNLHHMRFGKALELARAGAQAQPDDEGAHALLVRAEVAALFENGRRLTLDDRDVDALKVFAKALELDPASQEIQDWIRKTKLKLGDRWLQVALELHARGDLVGAMDAYDQSLAYHPGYEVAINGRAQAVRAVDHREYLADNYFNRGVHALSDYWLERANALFSYSNKYKPEQEHTLERSKQVSLLLAKQRQKVAQDYEKQNLYGAARTEYRMALLLAPNDPPSKAALERCTREVEAQRKLEDANYQVLRGNYERAEKLIDEGLALTTDQVESFRGLRDKIQEERHDKVYQEALALERDQRFEEAIAKYEEVLKLANYFKDTFARLDTLKGYVTLAAELYQKADASTDDKERLDYLKQIEIFWPEYRDIPTRIAELQQKLKP